MKTERYATEESARELKNDSGSICINTSVFYIQQPKVVVKKSGMEFQKQTIKIYHHIRSEKDSYSQKGRHHPKIAFAKRLKYVFPK